MFRATPRPIFSVTPAAITFALRQYPTTVCQNVAMKPPHKLPPTSAYVHLPFCRKRCHYCDFPIVALGGTTQTDDDPRIVNYIHLLRREIEATTTKPESHPNPPLETVFFGGGTPSLVPPSLVSAVLQTLSSKFGLRPDAEISMEMDPGTFSGEKMAALMELGVNRVSLGVQAFQEELLKACGRAHGVKEIDEAIEIVKNSGVKNWSMDLISSLPHQTPEMWEESLRLTIDSQPTHVSVYDLQVEQGTKFGTLYTPGEFPLPCENQSAEFYRTASRMLSTAGYNHYEISSYCKSGFECKHNSTYWNNKSFYGFGLGSASFIDGIRFSRPKKLKDYTGYVQNLENRKKHDEFKTTTTTSNGPFDDKENATDIVMLSLRTSKGLDLKSFEQAFGRTVVVSLCEVYRPYVETGHVVLLDEQRRAISADEFIDKGLFGFVRLSDPEGFLLSNELISLAFGVISP